MFVLQAQLKYKFIKTADVLITANAGNAYQMAVFSGDADSPAETLHEVGKVCAGTTNETRQQLDGLLAAGERPVAEVQYLYATDADILCQPVFVRLRPDKPAEQCRLSQLVHTNRAAAT